MPMKTCTVCDKKSTAFHDCENCKLYCCRDCFSSHIGLCKFLNDTKSHICNAHQKQVEKYCLNCCQLTCYDCVIGNHESHTTLHLREAVFNIREQLPNAVAELTEKEAFYLENLDKCREIQNGYKSIVSKIQKDETKGTALVSDKRRDHIRPFKAKIEEIEINCKEIENTCELIKETKNEFLNLEDAFFPMKYLFKWSDAIQLKDACETKFTGIVIVEKIIERFEQEKNKDMEMVFKNLELNSAPMKDSTSESMDNLTAQFSEKVSLKETPTETMSDQRFQVQGYFDIPGNAINLKQQSCNEIKKTPQKSLDLKPKINILEKEVANFIAGNQESERKIRNEMEECASLKILNERLIEQNHEMSRGMAVYQEEQTYMLDLLDSLPSLLTQIDQVTSKDDLKEFKLPNKQNEFMNKCTKAIEAIIDGNMKMKVALLKSQQELMDKCKGIAEWTTSFTSDTAEQMKVYNEQQRKTDIYKTDIQLKVSEIDKLSTKNEELIIRHRKLEQQLHELQTSNKQEVLEKHKQMKEYNDLQKRLEIQEDELRTGDRCIKTLKASVLQLQSQIGNRDEKIQLLRKEKENLKTTVANLNEDFMKNKQDLQSMKHRLVHLQSDNSNLEKDIHVLRGEKDDLQTRLSSVAGEKLTKGNPSITDLGDPNRPMKIGEKYGELYDNEWTDAMENVQNVTKYFGDMKDVEMEEILIRHLHRLLKCCYKDCFEMADGQLQKLGMTFAETMCLSPMSKEEVANLPVCREASIHRRANPEVFAKYLYEKKIVCTNILNEWDYHYKHENVMQLLMETTFFEKCVYLCWSMAIQDPVMYLDDDLKAGMPWDKNTYKEFVKSGDKVVYVVWPALFLHRNGPLLYKGVAQVSWKTAEQFV